jgi:hypothetical protein
LPATTFGPSVKKPEEIEPMERAFEKAVGLDFSGNHDWPRQCMRSCANQGQACRADEMNSDNTSFLVAQSPTVQFEMRVALSSFQ